MDTDSEAPGTVAPRGDSRPTGATTRIGWLWGVAAVVVVVVAGLAPLLFTPHYFWRGDTQVAYFGAYYHLGAELRQGHYPLMEPFAWRGGNHIVEGNFGLLSPIVMVIGIGATIADNAIIYMTLVKLLFLGVAAAGAYVLTRSYGGSRPIAFVVGVLVPLSGFTLYLDAPTWFPGLVVSGLLAVVWWAMRGCLLEGRNPLLTLLFGSLLAGMGYVFGTVMLAVVVVACMIDALRARGVRAAGKGLLLGILMGVPALVVRLPFVLSASVTSKVSGGVHNTGQGITTISDLLLGTLPVNGAGGTSVLRLVAAAVPGFCRLAEVPQEQQRPGRPFSRLGRLGRLGVRPEPHRAAPVPHAPDALHRAVHGASGGHRLLPGSLRATLGRPARRGPARHGPQRLYQCQRRAAVLARAARGHRGRRRRVDGSVAAASTAFVAVSFSPDDAPDDAWSAGVAAAFVGVWTILVVGVQHHYAPRAFAVDRGMPGDISAYREQLPGAEGDTFMVGHVDAAVEPGTKPKPLILIANSWYVSGLRMNNVHANTGNRAYSQRYCYNYLGFTCKRALRTLLSKESTTGQARVDLLSVNSIVLLKSDIRRKVAMDPPPGWHISDRARMSVTWTRDEPVPTAGGVAWASEGLDVAVVDRDDESVRLKVGDVPAGGGEVVLSRIDWPGYQVTNATVTNPVDDYLLTLRVSPADANSKIDVRYTPPHWTLLLGGLTAAGVIGLIWSIGAAMLPVVRRRRRI